ncbi:Retrovirus-related Pol polyprotein from type-1 retrotransposable element R1 [Araneus ventricosus]|uniref:Retrovirus-related Pol polyprotein from type-1 retrotransposable element R1 n=1 Tax=Araneus ventricosus TaxID=182803 RepID=A0A4Y2V6W4_ARAVE|nr:Retrovirus-related Pol polyprotein from type-1 retrotransposable element R1 [Araneus ventricosus]GBO21038.1 Retrovirus-related Pol polyprotein from type-1 retrotransposable element R1 [Araneus ventricosus]
MVSSHSLAAICEWDVLEEESHSDHKFVKICINYSISSFSFARFKTAHGGHCKFVYLFKSKVQALRKPISNSSNEATRTIQLEIHMTCKQKAVKKAQRGSWRLLCTLTQTPYGTPYLSALKAYKPPSDIFQITENSKKGTPTEFGLKILQKLYPKIAPRAAQIQPYQTLLEEERFSQQEIDDIAKKIPIGKAPGYDRIDNIIVKCLELKCFADHLKIGLVILFHKTGKEEQNIKSYRPISLLPTLGKLLEKLFLQRFNFQLKTNKLQHPLQYGFREGKSADDALLYVTSLLEQARRQRKHAVLISLDISGAFDSLQYSSIRDRFSSLSLFSNISETLLDTLRNRKVAMQTSEGPVLWEQIQGRPQGSCSGPAFWDILADEILLVQWPQGIHLQAFADDFAFIITDNTREGLRKLSKLALDKFKEWANKNKLHVSMEKSSYVLFSKLVRGPTIKWGNQSFKPFKMSRR